MNGENLSLSLDSLFVEQRQNLIKMLFPLVGCYQTSEDLSHEAYLKVSDASRLQPIHSPRAFLFQTARNLALDHLRKEKVRATHLDRQAGESVICDIACPEPGPEAELHLVQQVELLLHVLKDQPERRREMLILHKVHGWNYLKIAHHYKLSLSAVEKNVRCALAHCLSAAGQFDLER